MIYPSSLLHRALQADAIFSGTGAVLMALGAGEFAPLLNLPEALLREAGIFLIFYAAFVGWLSTRTAFPKILVVAVVAGNAAWTLSSIALIFSGMVTPNVLGEIALAAQAIVVGILAELQFLGLRRSHSVTVAA
jgi:hypothetical protein